MALFGMSKKEVDCDLCGETLPKKRIYGFDPSFRGDRKGEGRLGLCRKCFIEKMGETIREFKHRALFYHPTKENAYHFYRFEASPEEADLYGYSETFPGKHRSLIVEGHQKCADCGKDARFTWCYIDNKDIDTYNLGKFEVEDLESNFLCPGCLIERIRYIIERDDIVWDEFVPPADKEGICVSGQY